MKRKDKMPQTINKRHLQNNSLEKHARIAEFSFLHGRDEIIRCITKSKEPRFFAAVYGLPDGGKSTLINAVCPLLEAKGIRTIGFHGTINEKALSSYLEMVRCMFQNERQVYLFHYGIFKNGLELHHDYENPEDPSYIVRKLTGQKIHLEICIYNPFLCSPWDYRFRGIGHAQLYDIMISNPDSKKKMLP